MNFPKSKGGLWAHTKTSEKQPDVKGHVEIDRDTLRMLVDQAKAGLSEIKLQIAGWDRTAQSSGARYIYLTTEAYVPKEHQDRVNEVSGGGEPGPAPASVPASQDPWA
tara:strand:- start:580 stop:903 length:324 start_codon:yes stop_codon:yes gene_type:complete